MAQLISEDMKAIGVTMVIEQEPWNSYINSLMGGTYDTAICWGTGSGSTPYDLFTRTLASEFGGKDGGQAESNYPASPARWLTPGPGHLQSQQ